MQNITILNTSPQIDYSPFLCNVTGSDSFDPSCLGGWQVLTLGGETIVTTEGPGPQGANIVPQMFLEFQAAALFFTTSSSSNATINITVTAGSTSIATSANSSVGVAAILNLPESETTTLTVTFSPGQIPSHLDIGNFKLEVTANSSPSSFLPTPTLPPTVSLPGFSVPSTLTSSTSTTPSSSAQSSNSSHKQLVADAVGLTVGLGIGLTLVTLLGFYTWKRRRRRPNVVADGEVGQAQPRTWGSSLRRTDNSDSTRWF